MSSLLRASKSHSQRGEAVIDRCPIADAIGIESVVRATSFAVWKSWTGILIGLVLCVLLPNVVESASVSVGCASSMDVTAGLGTEAAWGNDSTWTQITNVDI